MKPYQKVALCWLAALIIFSNLAADYLFFQKSRSAMTSGEPRMQLDPVYIYGQSEDSRISFGYARIKVVSFDTTIAGVGRISVDYFYPPLDQLYFCFQPEDEPTMGETRAEYIARMLCQPTWFQLGWI
jgi:hypothetical protein